MPDTSTTMTPNLKLIPIITLWALIIHIVLIALTILEVFIYSSLFNSGQANAVYEQHAQTAGPYIGIIVGFAAVYFAALRLARKNTAAKTMICIGLPVAYILLDMLILVVSGTDWTNDLTTFSISYTTKLLAGYLALTRITNA